MILEWVKQMSPIVHILFCISKPHECGNMEDLSQRWEKLDEMLGGKSSVDHNITLDFWKLLIQQLGF